jgi:hypothetical protein
MDSQLITSIGYEALLTARDSIAQRIEQAHALLREAQAIADQNNMGTVCGSSPHQFMPMAQFLKPDGAAKAVALTDSAAWELLLHKSHVMDLMSGRKKHEWRMAIAKGEAPPSMRPQFEAPSRACTRIAAPCSSSAWSSALRACTRASCATSNPALVCAST